jgi:hypothetical protein
MTPQDGVEAKFKVCPFCGADDSYQCRVHVADTRYAWSCSRCLARGPAITRDGSDALVIAAWNLRAAASAEEVRAMFDGLNRWRQITLTKRALTATWSAELKGYDLDGGHYGPVSISGGEGTIDTLLPRCAEAAIRALRVDGGA